MEHVRDFDDFIIASYYLLQLAFKYALCVKKESAAALQCTRQSKLLILKTFISENRRVD